MNQRTVTAILTLLMLVFSIAGCANGFEKYYQKGPVPDRFLVPPYVVPPPTTPAVYTYSNDPKADVHKLLQDGYVYLGQASFNGNANKVSQSQAVEQGQKVGAAAILIHSEYMRTESGVIPYTVQNAPVVSTINTGGTVNVSGTGGYASGTYNSTGTVVTPGGTSTYAIPYSFERDSFVATFWAKRDVGKIIFGVNGAPLPDDVRRKLQRNTGVLVEVVVRGTPAFQANVLEGDVITKIANEDAVDNITFGEQVRKYAGRTIELQVLRNEQPKTISVALRPDPASR